MDEQTQKFLKVLLIEDDPQVANLISRVLTSNSTSAFQVEHFDRLETALRRISRKNNVELILLDLTLPDASGIDTFLKVHSQAGDIPIVVMTGLNDETIAVRAVHEGAQDYLVKGHFDNQLLIRALLYAIERGRLQKELKAMSLTDELTGLYNRRGFFTLAEQQIKVSYRNKKGLCLFFGDLDEFKEVNDHLGHKAGDAALMDAAAILKDTFRKSDIIARLGGDEFVVLMIEGFQADDNVIAERLQNHINKLNRQPGRNYQISLSFGLVRYHPDELCTIDELLAQADDLMYQHKQKHKFAKRSAA